jgi:hypothetical protein
LQIDCILFLQCAEPDGTQVAEARRLPRMPLAAHSDAPTASGPAARQRNRRPVNRLLFTGRRTRTDWIASRVSGETAPAANQCSRRSPRPRRGRRTNRAQK